MDKLAVVYSGMNLGVLALWLLIATLAGFIARKIVRGRPVLGLWGDIGFALLGTAVLTSLRQALLAQRRRHSRVLKGLGFASAMGIVSIGIHSFADFNLHVTVNSLWFIVLLAFAWVAAFVGEGRERS